MGQSGGVPARFQLLARTGHPDFLDLPWSVPLAAWDSDRLVDLARGISRHVVRFVDYDGQVYALKAITRELAEHEYRVLLRLARDGLPAVEAVGVVSDRTDQHGAPLHAVLITRHLSFSLPYRYLFRGRGVRDLHERLLDALAVLLVRLHLGGFFWGDCSLSNVLFRRDAGALSAYLVDAETGRFHDSLSDGQRGHDLELARVNVAGELLDLAAADRLPCDLDPVATSEDLVRRYEGLWAELTGSEELDSDERYRVEARLERLNELGFDVAELELVSTDDGRRMRVQPRVVEEGHHCRRLEELTGLSVQENQARRLLNDVGAYRAHLEDRESRPLPDAVAAYRWLTEVFEPLIEQIPEEHRGKLEPAELFHQLLEHRWYLAEREERDITNPEALASYIANVLPEVPMEQRVVPSDTTGEHRAL